MEVEWVCSDSSRSDSSRGALSSSTSTRIPVPAEFNRNISKQAAASSRDGRLMDGPLRTWKPAHWQTHIHFGAIGSPIEADWKVEAQGGLQGCLAVYVSVPLLNNLTLFLQCPHPTLGHTPTIPPLALGRRRKRGRNTQAFAGENLLRVQCRYCILDRETGGPISH